MTTQEILKELDAIKPIWEAAFQGHDWDMCLDCKRFYDALWSHWAGE